MYDCSGSSTEEFDFSCSLEKIFKILQDFSKILQYKIFKEIKEKFVIKSEYRLFCYQIGSSIKSLSNWCQIGIK